MLIFQSVESSQHMSFFFLIYCICCLTSDLFWRQFCFCWWLYRILQSEKLGYLIFCFGVCLKLPKKYNLLVSWQRQFSFWTRQREWQDLIYSHVKQLREIGCLGAVLLQNSKVPPQRLFSYLSLSHKILPVSVSECVSRGYVLRMPISFLEKTRFSRIQGIVNSCQSCI